MKILRTSVTSVDVTSDLMFLTLCLMSDVFAHKLDVELLRLQQYSPKHKILCFFRNLQIIYSVNSVYAPHLKSTSSTSFPINCNSAFTTLRLMWRHTTCAFTITMNTGTAWRTWRRRPVHIEQFMCFATFRLKTLLAFVDLALNVC